MPIEEGLLEEAFLFQQTLRTDSAQRNMHNAMQLGLQTRDAELRMGELCLEIANLSEDGK